MTEKQPSYILIDWGTSSFRLWGIDINGNVLFEKHEPLGMSKLKPADYESLLEKILLELSVASSAPVLICGMAGAAQGWQEANYVDLPTKLDELSSHAVKVKTQGRDVRILPGLAQRTKSIPDVLRGEETLLLGALASGKSFETYCLPGTHSKWVNMKSGTVERFQTFMTGEIFALLREHSTLSYFMGSQPENLFEHAAFSAAVLETHNKPELLTNLLFSIRSGALLFPADDEIIHAARLSGLLIGAELAGVENDIRKVGLISDGELGKSYATAMQTLNIDVEEISSEQLALHGLKYSAKHIWPELNLR